MSRSRYLLEKHTLSELFTVVYVLVDDYVKAAEASRRFVLPRSEQQKGSYSELMSIALVGDLLNQADVGLWFNLVKREYQQLFPELPDESRYYRVLNNLERIWADFALFLTAQHPVLAYSIDSKPLPVCKFKRHNRPRAMTEATVGYSSQGAVYGFKLHALATPQGMIVKFAITLPMKPMSPLLEPCSMTRKKPLPWATKPISVQVSTPHLRLTHSTLASGPRSWIKPVKSSSLFSPHLPAPSISF